MKKFFLGLGFAVAALVCAPSASYATADVQNEADTIGIVDVGASDGIEGDGGVGVDMWDEDGEWEDDGGVGSDMWDEDGEWEEDSMWIEDGIGGDMGSTDTALTDLGAGGLDTTAGTDTTGTKEETKKSSSGCTVGNSSSASVLALLLALFLVPVLRRRYNV